MRPQDETDICDFETNLEIPYSIKSVQVCLQNKLIEHSLSEHQYAIRAPGLIKGSSEKHLWQLQLGEYFEMQFALDNCHVKLQTVILA